MVRRVTWDAQDANGVDVFLRSGASQTWTATRREASVTSCTIPSSPGGRIGEFVSLGESIPLPIDKELSNGKSDPARRPSGRVR